VRIRVIKAPPGEAPESVRQAWVGLTLEALGRRPIRAETVGVISKPKTRFGLLVARLLGRTRLDHGYIIDAVHAIEVLHNQAPDAAAWWRQNAARAIAPGQLFMFVSDACEEIDAA
jgi:hypothetical protein